MLLSSSMRTSTPEATLARAKRRAGALGITRVTDITRLDHVGIPVYASIRPGAAAGSLCVNAGKGFHPIEAEVGAYMEAIEFALAEPGASHVTHVRATARDVLDGRRRPDAILDLCPKLGVRIRLDAPMECVVAEDVTTHERALVPAELVFLPFRPHARASRAPSAPPRTASRRATRSARRRCTGCASSSSATSVRSRECATPASRSISTPPMAPRLLSSEPFARPGSSSTCSSAKNAFGLAYFTAVINDPDACVPQLLNGGFGCHPHRSVAFVRAVAEAAQSRLSFIHGGRDDLVDAHARFRGWGMPRKREFVRRVVEGVATGQRVSLTSIDDHSDTVTTVEQCERFVLARLAALGFDHVYRVAFCRPEDDLQVVRVIVPRLEFFSESVFRVGPRLRDHAEAA